MVILVSPNGNVAARKDELNVHYLRHVARPDFDTRRSEIAQAAVPPGKYEISLCLGTACYVKGVSQILQAIQDELKIGFGEMTEDGLFSLGPARCLGACGLAPVVMIGERIDGELTPKKIVQVLKECRKQAGKEDGK
jgi:NADH:ubiquinone oxidoreductase subunit E